MNPDANPTPTNSELNPQINPEPQPETPQPAAPPEQQAPPPSGQNLFWVLVAVFAVLALEAAFRLSDLLAQRRQLDQARFAQSQNFGRLAEAEQAKARLHSLAFDLVQISLTNENARRIVRDFNIQFPGFPAGPAASAPASPPSAPGSPVPTPPSLLSAPNNLPPPSPSPLLAPTNPPTAAPSPLPPASNAPSLR